MEEKQLEKDNILSEEDTKSSPQVDDDDTDNDLPDDIIDQPDLDRPIIPVKKLSLPLKSNYVDNKSSDGDKCEKVKQSQEGIDRPKLPFVPDPGASTSRIVVDTTASDSPGTPVGQDLSRNSQYEILNTVNEKLKRDIKKFVDDIFTDCQSISLLKKAEFGKLAQDPEARLLFAIFVDEHRVISQRVTELTFYSLAQHFSIVLLECLLAEDFRPAKMIMNMMFTYYHEHSPDQPIIMRPDEPPPNPGPQSRRFRDVNPPPTPPAPAPSAEASLQNSLDSGRPSCSASASSSSSSLSHQAQLGGNILNRITNRMRNSPSNSSSSPSTASSMFGSRGGNTTPASVPQLSPNQLSPRSAAEVNARRSVAPAGVFANIADYLHLLEENPEPDLDSQAVDCDEDERNREMPANLVRTYLYTLLKEQEIFKSIRFWQSAFYESLVVERKNHALFREHREQPDKMSNEQRAEEQELSRNITFGLLTSFIHNMILLGLSRDFCQEFLDKHSTIAGLSGDQLDMLRSLIS